MALQTQGFALSALPRSPNVPGNVGAVDVKGIYDGVRQGLAALENVRQAPQGMALADAQMGAQTAQANAAQQTIPVQTAAVLADTPNRSALLANQTTVSNKSLPLALSTVDEQQRHLQEQQARSEKAASEISNFSEDYANAKKLASPQTQADDLENLFVKYPWLDQVPEYKQTAGRIKDAVTANRLEAQKEADRQAATDRANIIAQGGIQKATITAGAKSAGTPKEYAQENADFEKYSALAAQADNPEDQQMYQERADRHKARMDALNEQSARANKITSDQAIADKRITAQAQVTQANRDQKLALVNVKEQQKLSHALGALEALQNSTKHVDDLINEAIALSGPTTTGLSQNTTFLPFDARTLKGKLDAIRANVGFDALSAMRQNSPTGGALGQVSDVENKLLQNTIAALDQGLKDKELIKNLEAVREQRKKTVARLQETYDRDLNAAASLSKPGGAQTNSPSASDEFKIVEIK